MVDPSHGTGKWWMVPAMSKAAVAVGADGLLIEVHWCPEEALCDGDQSLRPDRFDMMMKELRPVALAVGREIASLQRPTQSGKVAAAALSACSTI